MIHGSSLLARRVFVRLVPLVSPSLVVRSVTRMLRCEVAPAGSVHSRVVGRCRVAETRLLCLRWVWVAQGNLVSYARMTLQQQGQRPGLALRPRVALTARRNRPRGGIIRDGGLPEAGSCAAPMPLPRST